MHTPTQAHNFLFTPDAKINGEQIQGDLGSKKVLTKKLDINTCALLCPFRAPVLAQKGSPIKSALRKQKKCPFGQLFFLRTTIFCFNYFSSIPGNNIKK